MKKKVFISSTYRDLLEHRKEVWELLGEHDVKVSGMEEFGARKSDSLTTCLEEVRESDIYIGILGMVYGSVDATSGKSYTQLEYEEAIRSNLDIFIYLIDKDESIFRLSNIDFINYTKLEKFKTELKSKHTVDFFKDPIDLKKKVNGLLNQLSGTLITLNGLTRSGWKRDENVSLLNRQCQFMRFILVRGQEMKIILMPIIGK